jgi:O-antigen/teichoic acid export membrane protein
MQSKLRSLASDTIVYGVSTVAGRFLTFLLTPLYTNYLSASEIGDVSAIYAMIAFVNIVYSLGMEPAFMRFWDRNADERNGLVFSVAFLTVAVIGVIVTTSTLLAAGPIAASPFLNLAGDGARLVAIASAIPLLDALVLIPFARLRMERRPRTFAILRLVSIVVTVAMNLVLVVALDMRVEGALLAGVVGSASTLLFFLPSLRSVVPTVRRQVAEARTLLNSMLRFGTPTVPASFSSIMVQVADRPILLMLMGNAAVGMYQTNFRLALPMMMFVTVFEYAWKPFYLNHRDDADAKAVFARVLTLFTIVAGVVFLATSLLMEYVVQLPFIGGRFIHPRYWSGLSIVPVVMFAYAINGMFINLAAGFHIEKRTSIFPLATGLAAAVSVGATWAFVPAFGIMGAAWAKVAAYAAGTVVLGVALVRVYPMSYDIPRIVVAILAAAAIYAGVLAVPVDGTPALLLRLAAVPAYVGVLIAARVLAPSTLRTMLSLVKR